MKRSRVKSKQRTQLTQAKVKELKLQNHVMEEKIKNLTKDLKFLKDLFLAQAQTKADKLTNAELRRLLAGEFLNQFKWWQEYNIRLDNFLDDDDDEGASTSAGGSWNSESIEI